MSTATQNWLRAVPFQLRRELATFLLDEANTLAAGLQSEAPQGPTGRTKASVRVRRGRHSLELFVEAGGQLTTVPVRKGASVQYDYALGTEFGNEHVPAQPWFYPGWRARERGVRQRTEAKVAEILGRL